MYCQVVSDLELFIQPSAFSLLTRISHILTEQGIKSYLIGGLVRDMLLGRDTADIDIAVAADALEVAPKVAMALGGKYVLLDEINGVGRVVLSHGDAKWELDFSTIKGGIEQDLARRDFTIDAMAIELENFIRQPQSPDLIDPFQGFTDLRKGVIRAVTETAFSSDPVRLLRAVRLAAELDFNIDSETEALIRRDGQLIASVPGERVREELLRLLAVSQGGQFLAYLDELGLLTTLIPELTQLKGVEQPKEHFWDVFEHSIQTVGAVDFLLRQGEWEHAEEEEVLAAIPWSPELKEHFDREVSGGSTRGLLLKLTALLHDTAKPQTKTIEESGRMRFLGHAKEGAEIVTGIMERLRFSTKEIKLVEVMVRHHLRPTQMSNEGLPTRRAIYRYFRDTEEAGIDILFLSLADHLATRGKQLDLAKWREHAQMVAYILAQHFEEESLTVPPKLIDGHDLISLFGLNPGPKIGEILEAVREAQAAGEVNCRDEALAYIEHLLASSSSKR
jgi:poly(A) polymerase